MLSPELLKEREHPVVEEQELTPLFSQQVTEILEMAAPNQQDEEKSPTTWYYRIPFAGVRYYSY